MQGALSLCTRPSSTAARSQGRGVVAFSGGRLLVACVLQTTGRWRIKPNAELGNRPEVDKQIKEVVKLMIVMASIEVVFFSSSNKRRATHEKHNA